MTPPRHAPGRLRGIDLLAGLLLFASVIAESPAQVANPAVPAVPAAALVDPFPSFVALRLNGQPASESTLVLRAGPAGRDFFLSAADADKLRLALAARVAAVRADNEAFFPLQGVAGVSFEWDEVAQVLSLTVAADVFRAEEITIAPPALVNATRPATGGFLTYDVLSQHSPDADTRTLTSGQAELGIFTPYGVFTQSTFATANGPDRGAVRLDSVFTIDQPERLASWRIGDGITRTPGWAPQARFGGIQYGTNFATQPTLITYPLNSMSGRTALPSVVDVYMNNVLTSTQQVQAGPFTLNDLPTINGQGELRLVVRDLMGREQVFLQPLYGSTLLLREGLSDWAVQAGALRRNYGLESNNYGLGFASGLWRRGINDYLTVEAGAEAAREHYSGGFGATWLMGAFGQGFASGAWSRRKLDDPPVDPLPSPPLPPPQIDPPTGTQDGHSWSLGWERRSTTLSFGAVGRVASDQFRSVAGNDVVPSRRELSVFGSYGIGGSSIALGYASVTRAGEERTEFAQLSLSHGFREWGFLSLSAATSLSGPKNDTISISYALPIDFLTTASASTTVTEAEQGRRTENRVSLQRSLPTGDGYGYRIDVSDQRRAIADLRLQNRTGLYSLEVARLGGTTSTRVGASGSLVYLANEFALGRRVEEGFGLVQVPGFPNVRVYLDNQEVGRTNDGGNLFVSRLRPYQVNRLSIEQLDLPLSAEVMTLKLDATPFLKSGVVVRFPVKPSLGGIARFIDPAGTDLPAGSVATLLETGEQFPVADGGQAYITGLSPGNRVRVSWGGRSCTLAVSFQPGDDPQPFLGTFTCKLE